MNWRFSGKQNVYAEIAEQYKEYIKLGLLAEGERLPSVRTAAIELGVNPNTVARAYALLEEWGFVRSIPKKGIYVSAPKREPAAEQEAHKSVLRSLRQSGVSKDALFKMIEEVYLEND